ncbi:MerR family transcriptional regulator [Xylophilus sp. ASV27]|uniref:MerR family transcriptional regulator n=1 Tax=Xylophilus sp. ASV27 TaxID=2795129 RepID=UPI0018EDFB83|nr:MerR family transcriptional regulator [Xylophilus sp. ASV27]
MVKPLPSIPAKRYFTIGEVGDLCDVKPHVLRYWEQEFAQLRPMKRRGNRRYYQRHEVLMIRRIRDLLYDEGFTISGARSKLQEWMQAERSGARSGAQDVEEEFACWTVPTSEPHAPAREHRSSPEAWLHELPALRKELFEIRELLAVSD